MGAVWTPVSFTNDTFEVNHYTSHLSAIAVGRDQVSEFDQQLHLEAMRVANVVLPHVSHRDIADAKVGQSQLFQGLRTEVGGQLSTFLVCEPWELPEIMQDIAETYTAKFGDNLFLCVQKN